MKSERRAPQPGFTLLEVVVALAIVALGLLAVFGQLNQAVTAATRLRDKTIAHWIALDRVTELRLTGDFPALGTRSEDWDMAYAKWHYTVTVSKTDIPDLLRQVDVSVAFLDQPDRPVATATGFVVKAGARGAGALAGWEPISADAQTGQAGGSVNFAPGSGQNTGKTPVQKPKVTPGPNFGPAAAQNPDVNPGKQPGATP